MKNENFIAPSVLMQLSVGSGSQNILFYGIIFMMIVVNFWLIKRKTNLSSRFNDEHRYSHNSKNAELSNHELVQKNEIAALKQDITALKEELERSYLKSSRLNDQLSDILDCLELTVPYDEFLWSWSIDASHTELTLSDYGSMLHGFPSGKTITLHDAFSVIVEADRQRIIEAVEYSFQTGMDFSVKYRVMPLGGGPIRWVKSTGKVLYEGEKQISALAGRFNLTKDDDL